MRPTSRQLAMRDPALMALFGLAQSEAAPASMGSDSDFGNDFGSEFGGGRNGFGNEYYGYGGDFGADPSPAPMMPAALAVPVTHPAHPLHPANHANTMAVLHKHAQATARTEHREMLLDPNKGSSTKVERYSFSIAVSNDITGTALSIGSPATFSASNQPSVTIRPQRFVTNSPAAGVFLLNNLQVANVNAFVGDVEDAYNFASTAVGVHLDLPTMSPANKVTIGGQITAYVPPGVSGGSTYTLVSSFSGPATLAG